MRKRLVLAAIAGTALTAAAPFAAHAASRPSAGPPPACVVVVGPSGLNVQVGYAPHGPATCKHL